MNSPWFFVILFGPIPVLILYVRIRRFVLLRRAPTLTDVPALPKPFDPKPEPTPGRFLRGFTPLQVFYLRQQFPTARYGFYVAAWILFSVTVSSLLPASIDRYGLEPPIAQRVWYSFLRSYVILSAISGFVAIMTSIFAAYNIAGTTTAAFYRTRPLTHAFLFWGRVLPAMSALLAAFITAVLVPFLLLLALYGPVWNHLWEIVPAPPSVTPTHISTAQVFHLLWMQNTSAFVTFGTIASSMVLIFAAGVLLICQPYFRKGLPKPLALGLGISLFEFFSIFSSTVIPHLSRTSASAHPYLTHGLLLLAPILLAIPVLYLAQISASRTEV